MSHKVIKDFGQGDDPTSITVSSYWVIAIFRQKNPVTYKRSKKKSFSEDMSKGLETFEQPLIITDDCFQLQVQSTKSNHITSLNAGLYPTEDYLQLINPGDWMFAWMVQSSDKFSTLIENIRTNKPCNNFDDGLKFFGKVANVRKQIQQSPNGERTARYTLTGTGFSEFDAILYYNPYLKNREDDLATQFGRLGYNVNDMIDKNAGGIPGDKAIPAIVDVMLGEGTPPDLQHVGEKVTYGTEGDYAYVLPLVVGQLLDKGLTTKSCGIGYADILEMIIGIQEYSNEEANESDDTVQTSKTFQPSGTGTSGSRRYCDKSDMLGSFLPTPPAFTDKTIWNILREFLNPATNEMYTALRVNPDGKILPTLILRQLPFTSNVVNVDFPVTKFLALPRWELHPILLRSLDIGRSDSLRFNFVDVLPITSSAGARRPEALSVTFPPRWDALDIARNGLRPYNMTVPAYGGSTRDDSTSKWKDLITDIIMGQHMTLTGTVTSVGIQSPICIGDNIEIDGVVYHIEALTHVCQLNPEGTKNFNTTIHLTNGMNAEQKFSDESIYAYISGQSDAQDNAFNPGVNSQSIIKRDEQELRTGARDPSEQVPGGEGVLGSNSGAGSGDFENEDDGGLS